MKSYTSEVRSDNEFVELPEQATFEIDLNTADRIRRLAVAVKERDAYKIVVYDYRVDWGDRTDCDQLNVSVDEFWFSTYIKHTDIKIVTDHFRISELP